MSDPRPIDVLTLGEALLSMRWAESLALGRRAQPSLAGAESNVAICLARLGHSVAFAGRVGADAPAELVLRTLRAEGVDTTHVIRDRHAPTGLVLFDRPVAGIVSVTYYRTGSAGSRLSPQDLVDALRRPFRALHVTGVTCAVSESAAATVREAVRHAKEVGATVSLDVNHRSRLWDAARATACLSPLVSACDVLVGSREELAMVAGLPPQTAIEEVAGLLMERGAREVVTKLGSEGARVDTPEASVRRSARLVTEVDPVGAGDAFTAGYLSARLEGADLASRLERGNELGGAVVASHGDWEGAPRRGDLDLFSDDENVRR